MKMMLSTDWLKASLPMKRLSTECLHYYPDEELLKKGNVFSEREFEIIRLIESGMDSDKVAEKLFLSVHTVNTHRRNILEKTGKSSISEFIYDLKERGVI